MSEASAIKVEAYYKALCQDRVGTCGSTVHVDHVKQCIPFAPTKRFVYL